MTNKWRPGTTWDEIKFSECLDLTKGGGTYADVYEVFERGAEAILEVLFGQGIRGVKGDKWGMYVFIPADPQSLNIADLDEAIFKTKIYTNDPFYGGFTTQINEPHPASFVIESGFFCKRCGDTVIVVNGKSGHCCTKNRGIKY